MQICLRNSQNDISIPVMLCFTVFYQLIFPVISDRTSCALVRLFVCMPPLMIIPVPYRSKAFTTMFTLVRLLASVDSHVHKQVASLIKGLLTTWEATSVVRLTKATHFYPTMLPSFFRRRWKMCVKLHMLL